MILKCGNNCSVWSNYWKKGYKNSDWSPVWIFCPYCGEILVEINQLKNELLSILYSNKPSRAIDELLEKYEVKKK